MGEQLLKCSANFTAGFDQLLQEGNFVDCSLAAEGRTVKAHRAVLSAASAYFKMLFTQEDEGDPVIIFTNTKYKDLEAVLRFIYRGEVKVSEDRLAEFLNVLTILQIYGIDCKELVVRKTNVTTCDNDNSFIALETTTIQEACCEKVEGEISLEELANKHVVKRYLSWEESSQTTLASDTSSNVSSLQPFEGKSDLSNFENAFSCSSCEPACGYELSNFIADIEIKDLDEEISSNVKIEKDDTTLRIEDEPTLEDVNDDNDREVSPGQLDAKLQFEDVVQSKNVTNIGIGEELLKSDFSSSDFQTSEQPDLNLRMCHIVERPLQLAHCSLSSMQYGVANNHEFNNLKGKPFKCSQCTYTSIRKVNFMMHMQKHSGEKPFKCTQCTHTCSQKGNLIMHMLTHTQEKPFKCKQCTYACKLKYTLIRHMRTHTGEKPFKCSQCTYACSHKHDLIKHMRTHTGEKPFKCSLCTYASSRNDKLLIHMRTHTGEKPYKCQQCTYASSWKSNLKNHMYKHAGGILSSAATPM